jgi:hypothetical protein
MDQQRRGAQTHKEYPINAITGEVCNGMKQRPFSQNGTRENNMSGDYSESELSIAPEPM